MLPRISAALGKFLTPISSAAEAPPYDQKRPQPGLTRQNPTEERTPSKKKNGLRIVPPETATGEELETAENTQLPAVNKTAAAAAFLQIFTFLKDRTAPLMKWLALVAYKSGARQGKSGAFRRGSILDRKIE